MKSLFTGATLADGKGAVHENYEIAVEGRVITRVGPARSGSEGYDRVIDVCGKFLMPGLIDTHVHFGGGDFDPETEHFSTGLKSLMSLEAAQRSLMAGCTTVRSAGAQGNLDIDVRDAINAGLAWGPRILASGRGITHTGGHCAEFAHKADGKLAVMKAVRRLVGRGVDSIKLFGVSAGVATRGADVRAEGFSIEEIGAAVSEARRFGKLTQVHSISLQATRNALAAGVSAIDHGHFLDEEVCDQMKQDDVVLVPTFGPTYYYTVRRIAEPWRVARSDMVRDAHVTSFQLALSKGVRIVMGSDLGFASRMKNGENALELAQMVEHGMRPDDALRAGTSDAARLLGIDRTTGSLEVGKAADLLVVRGNPLEAIGCLQTGIELVMRDGIIYRDGKRRGPVGAGGAESSSFDPANAVDRGALEE